MTIYAKPYYQQQKVSWDTFQDIVVEVEKPWALIGDFNTILQTHECQDGSNSPSWRGSHDYEEVLQDCDLIDKGFQGHAFTWKHNNLEERLDHLVFNLAWCLKFQNAMTFYLPYFKFDHIAIMVKMDNFYSRNRK